ncbi:MAG TPA: plastocyanin/azurin family copper-binding protein [Vicinamibacterales bacterium]|jgi:plastocyanin|nr:plastocyanin/azurin family copper-binding protein [Vicinamibacterales bacterium]
MKRLVLIAACAAACSCSKPEAPPAPVASAAPPSAASSAAAHGSVAGRVHAAGTAVVVLEPRSPRAFAPPDEKPVMDQAGLTFGPELLLVRTGYPVEFRNSDDTLHNVRVSHEETHASAFNVAIPTGESYTYTFERDGFYRVGCDIHPAMAASVFAASSPFTTLAAADGSFTFADVPPGAWTVTVYTGGKKLHQDVAVTGGVTKVTIE